MTRLAVAVVVLFALVTGLLPHAVDATAPLRLADDGRGPVEVRDLYRTEWSAPEPAHSFDGDVDACRAGSVDVAYLHRQVERLNTMRRLAGVDDVALDASVDAVARQQAAALIVAANDTDPVHDPSPDAACFSALGQRGSTTSNLFEVRGVAAIEGYLVDRRTPSFGHRRWLLSSGLESVAIGEVVGSHYSSSGHAIDVVSGHGASDPSLAIAWPPVGFVPIELVPSTRWTLQSARDAFGPDTVVTVRVDGEVVSVEAPVIGAANPDHFIAFEVPGVDRSSPSGTTVEITVTGLAAAAGRSEMRWTTTLVGDDAVGLADALHAETVFAHLVGRQPDGAERAALRRDPSGTLVALVGSEAHVGAEVERLYLSMLGRAPDTAGHAFWVDQIRSGERSLRDVVVSFFVSPEFIERTSADGAGQGGWVDAIYDRVLDRRPDASGRAFWVSELTAGARNHRLIVAQFYDSPEATADRLDDLVRLVLGRPSTAAERARWTDPDQRAALVALLAAID
ncbi:MAG: DUF4214 domain-containing protein [Acidimicrobiales bacterium]